MLYKLITLSEKSEKMDNLENLLKMESILAHLALTDDADLKTCKLERSSSSGSGLVVKTDDGQAVDAFDYADRGLEQTIEIMSALMIDCGLECGKINLGGLDERTLDPDDQFFIQELMQVLTDHVYGPGKITIKCEPHPDLGTDKPKPNPWYTSATEDKKKKPASK